MPKASAGNKMSSCVPGTFLLLSSKERSLATEEGSEKSASSRGFLQKACQSGHYLCVAVAWAMAVSLAQPPPCQGGLGLAASRELLLLHHSLVTALWCSMPQQSMGHHAVPQDTVPCHTTRHYATARRTVPCHVTLCHVGPCHATLCGICSKDRSQLLLLGTITPHAECARHSNVS